LSKAITRVKEESLSQKPRAASFSNSSPRWLTKPGTKSRSIGPEPSVV